MKSQTSKQRLGFLGEQLVAKIFDATLSSNRFDSVKDMTLNESQLNIEVKTQRRDVYRNMFTVNTINANQVNKCVSVDLLYFVEYDKSNVIKIWNCTDRKYETYETRDGRLMAGWPISKMTLIKEIEDQALAEEMRSLSQSRDFNKKSPYSKV